jgi:hypothetical protein
MELLRYVLPHLAAGCIGGALAAAALVASNVGSLRDLVLHTDGGWLAAALLTFGFVLTFGSAAIGHAIMRLGADED